MSEIAVTDPPAEHIHEWYVVRYNALPGDLTPDDFEDDEWVCVCGMTRDQERE